MTELKEDQEKAPCLRNCCGSRNLIILKITTFLTFSGFAICPFLAVQMKYLNVTEQEIAIINSFSPLLALFSRPLLALLADRRKWHKQVFIVSLAIGATLPGVLLFVPVANVVSTSITPVENRRSSNTTNSTYGDAVEHEHALFSSGFTGSLTFWLVLLSRSVSVALITPAWSICDATISNAVDQSKLSEFGKVRVFGSLGCLSLSAFYSVLTFCLDQSKYSDIFLVVCIVYLVLTVTPAVLFYFYKIENLHVSTSFTSALRILSKDFRVTLFLFACFTTGCIYGGWDIYCYWFLDEIGASSLCQSLMMTSIVVSEVFGMWLSTYLIRHLGATHCIWITLASEMVHMGSYSLLQNAWYALLIEGLTQCITFGLFMPASVVFVKECKIPGLEASLVALSSAVTFSLGMSCGALFFGSIYSHYGARVAFLSAAIFAAFALTIYVFAHFATRKVNAARLAETVSDDATIRLTHKEREVELNSVDATYRCERDEDGEAVIICAQKRNELMAQPSRTPRVSSHKWHAREITG